MILTTTQEPIYKAVHATISSHRDYYMSMISAKDHFLEHIPAFEKLKTFLQDPLYLIPNLSNLWVSSPNIDMMKEDEKDIPVVYITILNADSVIARSYIAYQAQQGHFATIKESNDGTVMLKYKLPEGQACIQFYNKQDCVMEEVNITKKVKRCVNLNNAED